jgi:drug/metabolite transporter (DMT)-like permease
MERMDNIHRVESVILQDEALRYRLYHTAYVVLLTSLGIMMLVGGVYLFFLPDLELAGIALVFASMLIGLVFIVTLKVRGVIGAASEAVLTTAQQRKAARNEIIVRGILFAVFMTVFSWFTDDEATPGKLALTGFFNFVLWSLGMYAYYVIRSKRSKDTEGDAQ